MIMCFNKKINDFNENILKNFESHKDQNSYLQSLMPDITDLHKNKCPHCKANNKLVKYGTYNRKLSILIDEHIEEYDLYVQRVKCNSCGSTHALLPNFIIPYKNMAIFSIAKIVKVAVSSSAYNISAIVDLSWQQIYNLVALVLSFFLSFKLMNNQKEYYNTQNFNELYFLTNCVQCSNYTNRINFFEFHNWFLFMQKFRNNPSPPITISASILPST